MSDISNFFVANQNVGMPRIWQLANHALNTRANWLRGLAGSKHPWGGRGRGPGGHGLLCL